MGVRKEGSTEKENTLISDLSVIPNIKHLIPLLSVTKYKTKFSLKSLCTAFI
jgi:hypothetical protein